jgi:xylulokinase
LGAGVGAGIFKDFKEAFQGLRIIDSEEPNAGKSDQYHQAYANWAAQLNKYL